MFSLKFNEEKLNKLCSSSGVNRLSIFGSYALNKETPTSDLDILLDYKKDSKFKSLFDLVEFQEQLKEIFKTPVDLVTTNSLHPYIKESVLNNTITLYEG